MASVAATPPTAASRVWQTPELRDSILEFSIPRADHRYILKFRMTLSSTHPDDQPCSPCLTFRLVSRDTAEAYTAALIRKLLLPSSIMNISVADLDFSPITKFFMSLQEAQLNRLLAQREEVQIQSSRFRLKMHIVLHFTEEFVQRCAAYLPLSSAAVESMAAWEDFVTSKEGMQMEYLCDTAAPQATSDAMYTVIALLRADAPLEINWFDESFFGPDAAMPWEDLRLLDSIHRAVCEGLRVKSLEEYKIHQEREWRRLSALLAGGSNTRAVAVGESAQGSASSASGQS